jgi:PPOX class probable F420-dependent enzyme
MIETQACRAGCSLPETVRERLTREPVVWLGTARADGAPHLLPLWFTWDGEAITLFSKPWAEKVRNIGRDPRVTIAIGTAGMEFDVALLDGHAVLSDEPVSPTAGAAGLARYAEPMRRLGVSPAEFLETYSQSIRIVPTRVVHWGQPGWKPRQDAAGIDHGTTHSR